MRFSFFPLSYRDFDDNFLKKCCFIGKVQMRLVDCNRIRRGAVSEEKQIFNGAPPLFFDFFRSFLSELCLSQSEGFTPLSLNSTAMFMNLLNRLTTFG